jgi:hypothetical protein
VFGRLLIVAIVIIALVASSAFLQKAKLTSFAETEVWDRIPTPGTKLKQIAVLHPGETKVISDCIDIKSYYLYKISLPDGRKGYVFPRNTKVTTTFAFLPPYSQPVVWNCF